MRSSHWLQSYQGVRGHQASSGIYSFAAWAEKLWIHLLSLRRMRLRRKKMYKMFESVFDFTTNKKVPLKTIFLLPLCSAEKSSDRLLNYEMFAHNNYFYASMSNLHLFIFSKTTEMFVCCVYIFDFWFSFFVCCCLHCLYSSSALMLKIYTLEQIWGFIETLCSSVCVTMNTCRVITTASKGSIRMLIIIH